MSGLARLTTAVIVALAIAACDGQAAPATAPTTSQPSVAQSASNAPTASSAPETTAPSVAPTEQPTAPSETSEPTSVPGSPGPSASAGPSVDTLKVKRTADCTSDNGSGTVGSIKLTWTSTGTTGVRISIDPPSPETAYDYPFADYPASGSAVLPFACDPPNHDSTGDYHLYVVTTLHDKGRFSWRYAKVYTVTATP